jgi:drug/metabolite transporter (DMT)-like permease
MKLKNTSLAAALLTPVFLGMNPILGKVAYANGSDPFTVAALRTVVAVIMLWVVYFLFWRKYLYIYPIGLINCVAVGFVNGIGSLMYYNGLNLLDASVAQLLNGMYLVFVIMLTRIGGTRIGWKTILRGLIALVGLLLVTGGASGNATWLGVGLMLGNSILFAGTVVMSQRAMYDMPAQTVTFYVLTTMAVVVAMARVAYDLPVFVKDDVSANLTAFLAIVGLATTTSLSRLMMFIGVKGLGSIRTTLLAILEISTSITLAFIFLDESFTTIQWWGVGILFVTLLMPIDHVVPRSISPTAYWPDITRLQLWQAAFSHAFGDADKYSSQEIRKMQELFARDKYTTQDMRVVDLLVNDFPDAFGEKSD